MNSAQDTNTFNYIELEETTSTNTVLRQMANEGAANGSPLPSGTVLRADHQTAGRGQMGNGWESEAGVNLLASFLLRPEPSLDVSRQFELSMAVALAVRDMVVELLPAEVAPELKVKWPNDIYVGQEKIAGILIENTLRGRVISETIVGVGLNVGQREFGWAPNATSVALLGGRWDIGLKELSLRLMALLSERAKWVCGAESATGVMTDYWLHLFRADGRAHHFADSECDFFATMVSVAADGPLTLRMADGTERVFGFKEVEYVIETSDGGRLTPNLK